MRDGPVAEREADGGAVAAPPRPAVAWLPRYDRRWLRGDVIAGIAVTALIVPKNLGYAGIAGIPLQNGLYAAAAGAIIYALFCTSRHISTGPSSSLAAVAGGAVVVTGVAGRRGGASSSPRSRSRPGCCSCCSPASAGLDRALPLEGGRHRLPRRRRRSTSSSASCPSSTGHGGRGRQRVARARVAGSARSATPSGTTLLVGACALALILAAPLHGPGRAGRARARRRRPARVVALRPRRRTASRSSATCRAGCPTPALPDVALVRDHVAVIVIAAVALLLIGFSQTAGDARAFADAPPLPHRRRPGVGRAGHGERRRRRRSRACRSSTSLSASSLNESSGARTPAASLVTGGLVIATLIVLAPLFSDLPKAVLGAVIIDAVVFGMIDVAELRRLRRVARVDFWIAVAAIVAVLSVGVLAGVVVGVALSLALARPRRHAPADAAAGPRGGHAGVPLRRDPEDETFPGIVVLRFDSGLFFATDRGARATASASSSRTATASTSVVLDLEGVELHRRAGCRQAGRAAPSSPCSGRHAPARPRQAAGARCSTPTA